MLAAVGGSWAREGPPRSPGLDPAAGLQGSTLLGPVALASLVLGDCTSSTAPLSSLRGHWSSGAAQPDPTGAAPLPPTPTAPQADLTPQALWDGPGLSQPPPSFPGSNVMDQPLGISPGSAVRLWCFPQAGSGLAGTANV